MIPAVVQGMVSNAALLLVLSFLYIQIFRQLERSRLVWQVVSGVLFGCVAIGVMLSPMHLIPGVVFDTRSVVISVGGVFGGPLVAFITFAMASLFRVWQGGAGALMGVLVSFFSAALGTAYYFWRKDNPKAMTAPYLYGFGVLVHLVMLACALALPGAMTWLVLSDIWLPVILVYPVATLLLCLLISDRESRVQAEKLLKTSEERYRRIVSVTNEGIWSIDSDQKTTFVNAKMAAMLGYSEEELLGRPLTEFSLNEDLALLQNQMEMRRKGQSTRYERRLRKKDGSVLWTFVSAAPMFEEGKFIGSLAMYTDISERKRAEKTMRQSEEKFRLAFMTSPDSLAINRSSDGAFLDVNQGFEDLTGFTREEAIGRSPMELGLWQDRTSLKQIFAEIRQHGKVRNLETEFTFKGGVVRRCLLSAVELILDGERCLISMTRDIDEIKKAQEAVRANEQRLHAILEASADPVVVYDATGAATFVNPAFSRVFGWQAEEVLGHRIPFVPPAQNKITQEIIAKLYTHEETHTLETKRLTKDGRLLDVVISAAGIPDDTGRYIGMVVNLTDVTQTKKLEAQLRQAQKMEAIGTLSGGIAHDFNNILSAIMGYTELAHVLARQGQPNEHELEEVLQAAERARKLVRQILTFSRKAEADLKPLSLNDSIRRSLRMLEHTLPKMIAIETNLAPDLKRVNADLNQMEQVIMNLATNAADAMPEGGRLLIETENITLSDDYSHEHLEVSPGDYVQLMVSDTGCGIAPQALEHIFDPFFTTKETGRGTGLGLSTVYGIVKAHHGYIYCYSEPGAGTTFKIYLPAQEAALPTPDQDRGPSDRLFKGSETILLVDDEQALRDLGSRFLSEAGYRTLLAANGEEALEVYRARKDEIDLVIMDLSMPGMGGHKCLQEILAINPQAKVVIASGYSANGQAKVALESGAASYVAKPFRLIDLLVTVRDVLDRK
jgi:two-component system cell cycle sensor histidine kinase/response regulator CckA